MNQAFQDLVTQLNSWADTSGLTDRAIKSCKFALRACSEDDIEVGVLPLKGWTLDEVKVGFVKHSLVFKHYLQTSPFIDTCIGLFVDDPDGCFQNGEKPIGRYELISRLDGQIEDDYLIFEESAPGYDGNL